MTLLKTSILFGLILQLANGSPIEPQTQDFTPLVVDGVDAPEGHSPHAIALTSGYFPPRSPIEPQTQDFIPLVVGGVDAPEGHSPHAMALTSGYHVRGLMCGASIISKCHVLTAAHCVEALINWEGQLTETLHGVYGSNKWESTENTAQFSTFFIHEKYDPFLIKYDIAVMCIKGTLSDSANWAIIPLNFNWVGSGDRSYVTGWGTLWAWGPVPARLQLIYVETISEKRCLQGVTGAVPPGWWVHPVDYRIEMCTLHHKGVGFGVCHGDSGSALVSLKTKSQTGIVSWGFPCARGAPDMFVRVSAFKHFILNILKKCCN